MSKPKEPQKAPEPAVWRDPLQGTEARQLAAGLRARRDPLRDKIHEVGRGLSLADTQTGR